MLKASPPDPEERAFATKVNNLLTEGKVTPFCFVDQDTQAKTYGLVFSLGSKRKNLTSPDPFHYDSPDETVKRVREWIDQTIQANRWAPTEEEMAG